MKLSDTPLRLVPNPFCAPLTAQGRAVALVEIDPEHPHGARHIGAKTTVTKVVRKGDVFGDKAKVQVVYDLTPRAYTDTAYHRAKLLSGEVFAEDGAFTKLVAAAHAALAIFVGDRTKALAAWREQGLTAIADMVDPPIPDKPATPVVVSAGELAPGGVSGALPPGSDELKEMPGTGTPNTGVEIKVGEEGVLDTVSATQTTEENVK